MSVTDRARCKISSQAKSTDGAADARVAAAARKDALGELVESLQDIDAQLNFGMNQSDYSDAARDASLRQPRVDTTGLGDGCKEAEDAANAAFDTQSTQATLWSDCLFGDLSDLD